LLLRDLILAPNDLRDVFEDKRAVALALADGRAAYGEPMGVEYCGEEMFCGFSSSSVSSSLSAGKILLVKGSACESSKAGMDGREGMSWSCLAWMRRHIREGVSSGNAIAMSFVKHTRDVVARRVKSRGKDRARGLLIT